MGKYYSYKKIMRKKADYNIIIGQRSNGKTYGILEYAMRNDLRVAYIRRYDEDITAKNMRDLYEPHRVDKEGYNAIIYRSKQFKYCYYDENGKITKLAKNSLCECFALSTWERTKGSDRGHFDIIVFDEFLSRADYLHNEFTIFQNVLSSIIRDRDNTQIYMLGNTVTRNCPYWGELRITKEIADIKQGQILTVFKGAKNTKIAIEYADSTGNTEKVRKFFEFGNDKSTMITQGNWEIENYPRADFKINKDNIIHTAYIYDSDIALDVVKTDSNIVVRVRPSTKDKQYVFGYDSSKIPNRYVTTTPYNPTNKLHRIILDCIKTNRVVYIDNEIGDKFNYYIREARRKENNILYVL